MSSTTQISWTDCTDNIITVENGGWWCHKISAGCLNCYAASLNQNSFFKGNKLPYSGNPPKLALKRDILKGWARQTKPKKHFVASMTDVFGEWVNRNWQFEFLDAMWGAPNQTFQILTKRPDVMVDTCLEWMKSWSLPRMPINIWCGTSVENNDAVHRIFALCQLPATRFVSFEPLLEDIELGRLARSFQKGQIDWAIIGGESGKNARPCHVAWVRSLAGFMQEQNASVFIKQLGSSPVFDKSDFPDYYPYHHVTGKGGDLDEFPSDLKIREFPDA